MASNLTSRQMRTIAALADVLIPEGGSLPGAVSAGAVQRVAELVGSMPIGLAKRLRLLIDAWDASTIVLPGYRKRFHVLDLQKREAFCAAARDGSLIGRIPYGYLKQLVFMAYGSLDEVEDAVGYDSICLSDGHIHR